MLKKQDKEVYDHLMQNQISLEFALQRWLKHLLSSEFPDSMAMDYWDYILGGVYLQHTRNESKAKNGDPGSFPPMEYDPFINLDIMCLSMIVSIRELLLESDFSLCLAYLLRYEQPEEPSSLIQKAIEIKRFCVKTTQRKKSLEEEKVDELFDFEILQAAGGENDWERRNATHTKAKSGKTRSSASVNRKE